MARAVAAGARGYIVKDAAREELAATVVQVLTDAAWRRSAQRPRQEAPAGPRPR